jgi:hypothetical protein
MRRFAPVLLATVICCFLVACQESAVIPGDGPDRNTRSPLGPVSPATTYVLYGTSSGGDALFTLDPETGETTLIGPLDPDPDIFVTPVAMAVRACDGGIFIWNNSNGTGGNTTVLDGRLLTADPCTGLGTAVDPDLPHQGQISALAFHPAGRLFGTDSQLFEVDPLTGEVTTVGPIGARIGGADCHPVTGVLYGAELSSPYRFGTIDLETGALTEIGRLDIEQGVIGALAFDPSGNTLYGTSMYTDGQLFEIDIETGEISNIVPIVGTTPQGMGFAPVCGEGGGDCGLPTVVNPTLVIKPGGCPNPLNPKSRGVLPMALLGADDFDINDIDVSTLEINGVSPLRSNHEDVGGPVDREVEECECAEGDYDGIMDLTLKFSTPAIVATLGSLSRGDVVELTLTGTMLDGTSLESSECVVIVGK